jgi:CRISPR system Cascade subunit CasA
MAETAYDLCTEPLLSARVDGENQQLSLPELLAALGRVHDVALLALQPHQQHAWHAFAVQLAAILLHGNDETDPRQNADTWRDWMRAAAGGPEPWCLVAEDLEKPAFFQPPVPEKKWSALKAVHPIAGELDVLITAKNHDVKERRMAAALPEHWVHVLVTLQTTEGFSGRGNYGVARMNGGFGSRPCVAYAPSVAWPARFRRDVAVALEARAQIVEDYGYRDRNGLALVWLEPWDGKESLQLSALDPFFIEVCRRVRLRRVDGDLAMHRAATKAARIDAKDRKGATGDLWTPLKAKDNAALTLGGQGFGYRTLSQLMFSGDWHRPPAQHLRVEDGERPVLMANALVRGQGKTEGFHERIVRIPPERTNLLLGGDDGLEKLDELSKQRIDRVRLVQRKILRPALLVLLQGDPQRLDLRDDRAEPWVTQHDQEIDSTFFEALWRDVDASEAERHTAWDRTVLELAERIFEAATRAVPLPSSRRYRVLSAAHAVFHGSARKNLPDLFAADSAESEETTDVASPVQ